MIGRLPQLCGYDGCRRIAGHRGNHDPYPAEAWEFLNGIDRNKIAKAGFATPRGGAKGAYQNHVVRNNKVIIPFERLPDLDLSLYKDGYVIRLLPDQYFEQARLPKEQFRGETCPITVGENAFVLYRTHESFERFPPLEGWQVRSVFRDGVTVTTRRGEVTDAGHYVLRIPRLGEHPKRVEGPPQGLFAPEYADEETNFLCKCVLAWLIVQTQGSPYTLTQASHVLAVLRSEDLDRPERPAAALGGLGAREGHRRNGRDRQAGPLGPQRRLHPESDGKRGGVRRGRYADGEPAHRPRTGGRRRARARNDLAKDQGGVGGGQGARDQARQPERRPRFAGPRQRAGRCCGQPRPPPIPRKCCRSSRPSEPKGLPACMQSPPS